ncbi:MAG: hypothetical protein IKE30_03145 [Clostridia bacterium]|nr:hypothetical protein [Clostridia bacterium]
MNRRKYYPLYACAALIVALAVALAAVCVLKARDARLLRFNREMLIDRIETDLNQTLRSYDKMALPNADVAGDILPDMRQHLYAADALNEVLVEVYGESWSVLDHDDYREIESVMDEVEKQISFGQKPEQARARLAAYMMVMQGRLTARFGGEALLMPRGNIR